MGFGWVWVVGRAGGVVWLGVVGGLGLGRTGVGFGEGRVLGGGLGRVWVVGKASGVSWVESGKGVGFGEGWWWVGI